MDFETNYDKLLQISTCGRDDTNADACHHPYEPTPYRVLERLEGCGLLRQGDTLLDYEEIACVKFVFLVVFIKSFDSYSTLQNITVLCCDWVHMRCISCELLII